MRDANKPSPKNMIDSKLIVHMDQQEEYEAWEKAKGGFDYGSFMHSRKEARPLTDAQYESVQSSVEAAQHNADRR